MKTSRAGIILPAVVFVLLIIELLAVTALAIAYQESAAANQKTSSLRAELAARDGAIQTVADTALRLQMLAPGMRLQLPARAGHDGAQYEVAFERLSGSLFLARSEGSHGPANRRIRAAAALLFSAPDPLAILAQFPGALGAAGSVSLLGTAEVDGSTADRPPAQWLPADCTNWLPIVTATPGLTMEPATSFDRLGGLSPRTVDQMADRHESGTLDLVPVASGTECMPAALGNWGTPLDPAHPCSRYFPLIYVATDLTVTSGSGQGILVVEGNLTMSAGTRFFGLVLVRGRIVMAANSEIVGAVLAQSLVQPTVLDGASVRRCDCAIGRALLNTLGMNRLTPRRGRAWIPLF